MQRSLNELEQEIGIKFRNTDLAHEALTHRSYREENQSWPFLSNERLEYFGDAVLQFVVTDFLFRRYPDKQEGDLTKIRSALVNAHMLAHVAHELNLSKYLYLSKGIRKISDGTLEDALEALIGAIYQDRGYSETAQFIKAVIIEKHLDELMREKLRDRKIYLAPERSEKPLPLHIDEVENPIGYLQEIRAKAGQIRPRYETVSNDDASQDKIFQVEVYLGDQRIADGRGQRKQEAKRNAARHALIETGICFG